MQHDFILLDRSGSMAEKPDGKGATKMATALDGISAYIDGLVSAKVDTGVTLATFDQPGGLVYSPGSGVTDYSVIRERIIPSTWKKVDESEVIPRGGTPLWDAVGRCINIAIAANYEKVAITIVTDGEENSSKEHTKETVRTLIEICKKKNWQVNFVGCNFDAAADAAKIGVSYRNTVASSIINVNNTMSMMGAKRAMYGVRGQSMDFTVDEQSALSSNDAALAERYVKANQEEAAKGTGDGSQAAGTGNA